MPTMTNQVWTTKIAATLAMLSCLLIGSIGGGVAALCIGQAHVAVEIPIGRHDVPIAAILVSNAPDTNCVDTILSSPVRVERISGLSGDGSGNPDRAPCPILSVLGIPAWPSSGILARSPPLPDAQVAASPGLDHLRTVVLLN